MLTEINEDPRGWFGNSDPTVKDIRGGLGDLKSYLLLLSQVPDFRRVCIENLRNFSDPNAIDVLKDILERTPVSTPKSSSQSDFQIAVPPNSITFDDVTSSLRFDHFLSDKRRDAKRNEPREEVFSRCFAGISSVASEVRIIDRYAATALTSHNVQVSDWFLRKIMEVSDADISIYSVPPALTPDKKVTNGNRPDPNLQMLEPSLKYRLQGLKKDFPTYKGKLTVRLDYELQHNRRLNFRFLDHVTSSFILEKGLQSFSKPMMESDYSFTSNDMTANFDTCLEIIHRNKALSLVSV